MSPFVQLRDPSTYVACDIDLVGNDPMRSYWCDFFPQNIRNILAQNDAPQAQKDACVAAFDERFQDFKTNPQGYAPATMMDIDRWREELLREHGFPDPWAGIKRRENEKMLPLLPTVVQYLDDLPAEDVPEHLIRGVFAGNVFDMGAPATAASFHGEGLHFERVVEGIKPRPWLIDDFGRLRPRLLDVTHRHCVYFIDNAGSDVLLGAIPFIRHLARGGCRVTIAANELAALNDMTIGDLDAWWPRIVATLPELADLPIDRVSTGTGDPEINLLEVSDALNEAAADADLVVFEGMGRGVESNLNAELKCDRLNLAMLKDEWFAKPLGGGLYDVVCRYVPA